MSCDVILTRNLEGYTIVQVISTDVISREEKSSVWKLGRFKSPTTSDATDRLVLALTTFRALTGSW